MKKVEDQYDGRNVVKMAPYAQLMGKANGRNMTRFERIDVWWDTHPKIRCVLGVVTIMVMVGFALYHAYTFNS